MPITGRFFPGSIGSPMRARDILLDAGKSKWFPDTHYDFSIRVRR